MDPPHLPGQEPGGPRARQGLQKPVPAALPSEFFDTLGAIQESIGQTRDAEATYLEGLKKDSRNPALNFHYGKLLTADPDRIRAGKARSYLTRALADRRRLSPNMAREADHLLARPERRHQRQLSGVYDELRRRFVGCSPSTGAPAVPVLAEHPAMSDSSDPRQRRRGFVRFGLIPRRRESARGVILFHSGALQHHDSGTNDEKHLDDPVLAFGLGVFLGPGADSAVAQADDKHPVVVMDTSMGEITVELDAEKAPITTENFLKYVDDKYFDGLTFHRVIPGFMIQGGGFDEQLREKRRASAPRSGTSRATA